MVAVLLNNKILSMLAFLGLATAGLNAQAYSPTVSTIGSSNGEVDVLVPADGLPLVVYRDVSAVKALKCANALCTGVPSSVNTVMSLSGLNRVRVVSAADGLPLIGLSLGSTGLRAIKCNDAACASSTLTILDNINLGSTTDHDLIVPPDGLPIFAYYDASAFDLRIARCANANCTAVSSIVVADATGFVGRSPSIVMAGGLPSVVYNSLVGTTQTAKLLRCGSLDCSTGNAFTTLSNDNPSASAMILGRDGFPLIVYKADVASQDSLKLVKCSNVACSTFVVSTLDSVSFGSGLGDGVQMVVGGDGLPVLSYRDMSFSTTKLAHCTRPDCSAATINTIDANGTVFNSPVALAKNADGLPLLVYAVQGTTNNLRAHSCNTRGCL